MLEEAIVQPKHDLLLLSAASRKAGDQGSALSRPPALERLAAEIERRS